MAHIVVLGGGGGWKYVSKRKMCVWRQVFLLHSVKWSYKNKRGQKSYSQDQQREGGGGWRAQSWVVEEQHRETFFFIFKERLSGVCLPTVDNPLYSQDPQSSALNVKLTPLQTLLHFILFLYQERVKFSLFLQFWKCFQGTVLHFFYWQTTTRRLTPDVYIFILAK